MAEDRQTVPEDMAVEAVTGTDSLVDHKPAVVVVVVVVQDTDNPVAADVVVPVVVGSEFVDVVVVVAADVDGCYFLDFDRHVDCFLPLDCCFRCCYCFELLPLPHELPVPLLLVVSSLLPLSFAVLRFHVRCPSGQMRTTGQEERDLRTENRRRLVL